MVAAKANGTAYLTLDDIRNAVDVKEEDVETPEWGGVVRVRGLTKKAEMSLRARAKSGPDPGDIDAELLEMLFLVEGMIEPRATDDDIAMLKEKNGAVVNRVLRRIMDLSGISETAREAVEKNFRPGPEPEVPVQAGT